MNSPYEDIIGLPHFHDSKRPFMSNRDRAAQFMPFKSLNEYDVYIDNTTSEILNEDNYIIIEE